jgi:hypothetical protein
MRVRSLAALPANGCQLDRIVTDFGSSLLVVDLAGRPAESDGLLPHRHLPPLFYVAVKVLASNPD